MVPLLETVLDPNGFIATTIDGQLRSDLIKLLAPQATDYRLWKQKPENPMEQSQQHRMTPEIAQELSRDRSGRWEYYGVQLLQAERLLFSAGRYGTELMIFHLPENTMQKLADLIREYDEVTDVKIYPMPKETLSRWARRVV